MKKQGNVMKNQHKKLAIPSALLGGCLLLSLSMSSGLTSCDSTAKFTLPDRKFYQIEVISAFPAQIDGVGNVKRVCGAAVDEETLAANGIELVNNFVSANLANPPCGADDRDFSIKEGELIELYPVKASGTNRTITPAYFKLTLCGEADQKLPAPPCLPGGSEAIATSVQYKNLSPRCIATGNNAELSRVNVAVLVDNSGSTAGLVDKESFLEEASGNFNQAGSTKDIASDFVSVRVDAVDQFVQTLNTRDRALVYYFDEQGVHVACEDNRHCVLDSDPTDFDVTVFCDVDADCGAGSGRSCIALDNQELSRYKSLPFGGGDQDNLNQQNTCFGANNKNRLDIHTALDKVVRSSGNGRAPVWAAIDEAYKFMTTPVATGGSGLTNADNRHIIIITDGPDTCSKDEDYNYKGIATLPKAKVDKCRPQCSAEGTARPYQELIEKMKTPDGEGRNWQVHLHVIQFQSPGYKTPDAKLQQLACASDGTYQFINSEQVNKAQNNNLLSKALTNALNRVRNSLSGSWRTSYKLAEMQDSAIIKKGEQVALDGSLDVTVAKFTSLQSAKTNFFDWRFSWSNNEDRRLLVRMGCATSADCNGGTDDCASQHCSSGGVCVDNQAPDLMPCTIKGGAAGKCCKGVCAAAGGSCSCIP